MPIVDVLQVITDTDRRGGQTFATDLHPALEQCGLRVRTVALVPGTAPNGLAVPTLGKDRLTPQLYRRLASEMRTARVTIAHGSSTLVSCAVSGAAARRPFVYRQISDVRFWAGTYARRARVTAYMRRPELIVALSERDRRSLHEHLRVEPERVRIVPNGVPRARLEAQPSESVTPLPRGRAGTVAYLGALVPEKGVDVAIKAVGRVSDVVLLVAGAGSDRDRLERMADAVAPGRVRFLGNLSSVAPVLNHVDLVVLPSLSESFPATLIESGMAGLPSVSSAVGAIPEIVRHGTTGFLTAPNDADAMAQAMALVLGDADRRRRMGDVARRHCEQFEIGPVAEQWAKVIEEAALRGRTRS